MLGIAEEVPCNLCPLQHQMCSKHLKFSLNSLWRGIFSDLYRREIRISRDRIIRDSTPCSKYKSTMCRKSHL